MIIFITGSDGLIGNELALYFKKKNVELILHTKKKRKKNKNFYFSKDLSKEINLSKIPDFIIHCAGINKSFDETDKKKNKFLKNIKITKNIIKFGNTHKIKKIIFLSSIDVYGNISKNIVDEKTKPKNPNNYGKSKLNCEKLLTKKKNFFKSICLRIPGVLTVDISKNRTFLIDVVKKIYLKKKIVIFNENNKFNNLLDVKEIFDVINILLYKKIKQSNIYNLSANLPISVLKVIKKFEEKLLIKANIHTQKSKKNSFIINNKKIQKSLGIKISSVTKIIDRYCGIKLKKK
jgi:nucleoside-diphosphate-sugar epimerase